jgi:hypothetical protein
VRGLVRPTIVVDGRVVSTWRVAAGAGLLLGALLLPPSALRAGLPPMEILGFVPVLLAADQAFARARRRLTGHETWVLYEHLALTMIGASALAGAFGMAPLGVLDAFWPPLCAMFALGRVGCTVAGCCRGVACSVGIRYPPSAGTWARGERRAPVQLAEAVGWAALGASGFAALGHGVAGLVSAGGLAGYAVLRAALEGWRGDERPTWRGVSVGRAWSALALVVAGGLAMATGERPGSVVLLGVATLVGLALTHDRWLAREEVVDGEAGLAAFAEELLARRPNVPAIATIGPHRAAAHWSADAGGWVLSLDAEDLGEAEAAARLGALAARLGATLSAIPVRSDGGVWLALTGADAAARVASSNGAPPRGAPTRGEAYFRAE